MLNDTRNRFFAFTLGLLTLTAGCVPTVQGYDQMTRSWVGQSEQELLSVWGVPARTYSSGGATFLTYVFQSSGYVPGIEPTYQSTVIGNSVYTTPVGGMPGYTYNDFCETTFRLERDVVRSVSYRGNACLAVHR